MLRRTKIVATLGPATDDENVLRDMINAGLDVARLNFSHGDADEHRRRAELLRRTAEECGRDVGLMGDLQGPKIRVRRFKDLSVKLEDGAKPFSSIASWVTKTVRSKVSASRLKRCTMMSSKETFCCSMTA